MSTVKIPADFRIELPNEVREALCLSPGDEMQIVSLPGRVELVPVRSIREARGFLQGYGMDSTIERDDEDRL